MSCSEWTVHETVDTDATSRVLVEQARVTDAVLNGCDVTLSNEGHEACTGSFQDMCMSQEACEEDTCKDLKSE